jgi:ribosome-binding protein aMBF1 (putative translation factor)
MQTMMQFSRQNPQLNQIMQMTNGKTPAQMEQMVRQAAQQRGVDLNQLAQQLGIKLPG